MSLIVVPDSAFLNEISQKAIDPNKLTRLQNDVVQCLVSFEMVFPPSFFNIMTHLLVHIVKEINILDPLFLHNMFPFERYMAVLKKYVRNRSRPEDCIAKGYGTEEVIEFCVDFIDELIGDSTIDVQLQWLARGPSATIMQYQGYEINGYTFYTRAQDERARTKIVVYVLMQ